jgi:hypothetical protein
MSEREIVEQALTELMALEEKKLDLIAPYQGQIEALRGTIAAKIRQIEQAMDDATYGLDIEIGMLAALIKGHGVAVGATVKVQGEHGSISSVYYKPTLKWNKDKLVGFAAAHPELLSIAEEVPASVQIRHGK